jgi:hypothetical protein
MEIYKWIGEEYAYFNKYAIYYPDRVLLIKFNGNKEILYENATGAQHDNKWVKLKPKEIEQLKIELL